MLNENTPLTGTTGVPQGPAYVFPNGVSPRSRVRKMHQFQCCISSVILGIILIALLITYSFYGSDDNDTKRIFAQKPSSTPPSPSSLIQILEGELPIDDEHADFWAFNRIDINETYLEEAVSYGVKALGDKELLEEDLQTTPVWTPAFRHYRSLNTNIEARKLSRRAYVEQSGTIYLAKQFNYTKEKGRSSIGNGPMTMLFDPTLNFTCDRLQRYRRANGICNNLQYPRTYGAAMTAYRRIVAPDYGDGISSPRISHSSKPLPPARQVSIQIHRASYPTDSNFTVMLAVFGQFLDHDITATSLSVSQDGESIDCCTVPLSEHPECFPVPIAAGDPFFDQYNITCMNFVRSAPAPTGIFGPRQQFNQATAFIDGSVIYGNTDEKHQLLRTNRNGKLRMFITSDGRELLPISTNPHDGCNRDDMSLEGKYCFESGDDRSNENLLLASMHLIFGRHHNYLARGLQSMNPSWNDEQIFQESRKILGAQMQHITYNEFLPILLGVNFSHVIGIVSDTDPNAPDTYDPQLNPTIANCFAAAAFRFAHTLLPSLFNMTRDNSTAESMELHRMLFNPFSLWNADGVDDAIHAAVNTPVMRVDRFFTPELTQKLFEGPQQDELTACGLDLVSLNIQRGRDHGLPSYPVYRKHCKLSPVNTWKQMAKAIDQESLKTIRQIYNSPYDVDVYTGALSEKPLKGAIFGPLLTCLISDQFLRIKKGDSFWYERKRGAQKFTRDQLKEIYKTTLAGIICRNSDSIQKIRSRVMERWSQYANCADVMNFNFSPWAEKNLGTKKP